MHTAASAGWQAARGANRCMVRPSGSCRACGGWHGRQEAVERSQRAQPQAAGHHGRCRRHPQACGAHRSEAAASKPGPRPEVGVGHGGDGRKLRRGRAHLVLALRAAATASIAARLICATAPKQSQDRRLTTSGDNRRPCPGPVLRRCAPHRPGIPSRCASGQQLTAMPTSVFAGRSRPSGAK